MAASSTKYSSDEAGPVSPTISPVLERPRSKNDRLLLMRKAPLQIIQGCLDLLYHVDGYQEGKKTPKQWTQ